MKTKIISTLLIAATCCCCFIQTPAAEEKPALSEPKPENLEKGLRGLQDGGRKELKEAAVTQEVKEELESPDGVALELLPGGGWRLFGRGSGTYDFNEADEIRGATQDATLRAKAAITKFLKERVQTAEEMNNISTKLKNLTAKTGEGPQAVISKTDVQTRVEQVVARADEVLRGVVVIDSQKQPIGNGGTVTVTVGVSSKTQAVSNAIKSGKTISGPIIGGGDTNAVGTLNGQNQPEKKKSKTDF
jgi:hypothetical protein